MTAMAEAKMTQLEPPIIEDKSSNTLTDSDWVSFFIFIYKEAIHALNNNRVMLKLLDLLTSRIHNVQQQQKNLSYTKSDVRLQTNKL